MSHGSEDLTIKQNTPIAAPLAHRPPKVLDSPAIARETAKTGIHTGAQGKKYETNPISSKPIVINELRLVLRAP